VCLQVAASFMSSGLLAGVAYFEKVQMTAAGVPWAGEQELIRYGVNFSGAIQQLSKQQTTMAMCAAGHAAWPLLTSLY
jgi:hypothetical protein